VAIFPVYCPEDPGGPLSPAEAIKLVELMRQRANELIAANQEVGRGSDSTFHHAGGQEQALAFALDLLGRLTPDPSQVRAAFTAAAEALEQQAADLRRRAEAPESGSGQLFVFAEKVSEMDEALPPIRPALDHDEDFLDAVGGAAGGVVAARRRKLREAAEQSASGGRRSTRAGREGAASQSLPALLAPCADCGGEDCMIVGHERSSRFWDGS
jgi:hypothetical protein